MFETHLSDKAALNRFEWLIAQLVMYPPYDPPKTPRRSASTNGNFFRT